MPVRRSTTPALLTLLLLLAACGEFDDYRYQYESSADVPLVEAGEPWVGDETVRLVIAAGRSGAADEVILPLAGIEATEFIGAPAIVLARVVEAAALTDTPESFRYGFTATDDYDLLVKRGDVALLPSWDDLQHGYLYRNPDGDMRTGWDAERQPWGSAISAYRVKYMDGGLITLYPTSPDSGEQNGAEE